MNKIKVYAFADEASPLIDGQIQAMKENGLDGLEIRNADHVNVSDLSDATAKEIKAKLDNAGFVTWSIGSPIGKIDMETGDFKTHTEKFRRTLEIAAILQAPNIRLFSFYIPKDKNPDDCKNEVIDRLGTFAEIAQPYKVTLCHENEKGIYGDTAERCLALFKAVPQMKGIFDPANFVQCGQDSLQAWELLAPYIHYLHIKDAGKNDVVVPAGMGDGNVAAIAKAYLKNGGRAFTIEPHLRVFDGFAQLEQGGEDSSIAEHTTYKTGAEAFTTAVNAFRKIMEE